MSRLTETIARRIARLNPAARHRRKRIDRLVQNLSVEQVDSEPEADEEKTFSFPPVAEIADKIRQNMRAKSAAESRARSRKRKVRELPSAKLFAPPPSSESETPVPPRRRTVNSPGSPPRPGAGDQRRKVAGEGFVMTVDPWSPVPQPERTAVEAIRAVHRRSPPRGAR